MVTQHSTYQDNKITLVIEKIEEWDIFYRFLDRNPDVKEKYETYKTFEILKDDH